MLLQKRVYNKINGWKWVMDKEEAMIKLKQNILKCMQLWIIQHATIQYIIYNYSTDHSMVICTVIN